jgi:glucokinase
MDVATLSQLNEFLVLDAVRSHGETTRTAIARSLGLSPASVSRIVKRLLDAGLVTEAPEHSAAPGRNPGVIRLNERAGGVIAIDLGGTKCHAALADLTGEVLAEDFRATHDLATPVATLVASIEAMRAVAAAERLPVRAVVVGIPAVIDPESGLAVEGPNVGWSGFDLHSELEPHVGEPLLIENDVNLAALGVAWRGEGRSVDSFVTVSIGTGIGAAIVAGGELLRGRRNAAGELGSIVTRREHLHAPAGSPAGFESVASGPAVAARARELLGAGDAVSSLDPAAVTAELVFAAAAAGDALARGVIGELLEDLAIALISVTGVIDPDRIVLEGSVGRSLEPYLPVLRDLLARRLDPVPDVRVSHLGPNATVAGAIASALALIRQDGAPAALPTTIDVSRSVTG